MWRSRPAVCSLCPQRSGGDCTWTNPAQVEITERDDGVLELRPSLPIPAEQRWFWTKRQQPREREADDHVAAQRVTVHEDGRALLEPLDQLDPD